MPPDPSTSSRSGDSPASGFQRSPSALRAQAARRLAAAGVDSASSDATWLLSHVAGVEPGRLLLVDALSDEQVRAFDDAVERRAQRIPLQHVLGATSFHGVDLKVGPGVFVPRPETELLVEWALAQIAAHESECPGRRVRVADLCSGSGALAVAIAASAPNAEVVAVERSARAAEYLAANIAAQPPQVSARLTLATADVTDAAAMARVLGKRDVIVSNPPYVPEGAPVSAEVAADPHDAVFSGTSGMDCIVAMAPVIADALVGGGGVAIEHDDTTADAVVAALSADGRFTRIAARRDLAQRPRYVTAERVERWDA